MATFSCYVYADGFAGHVDVEIPPDAVAAALDSDEEFRDRVMKLVGYQAIESFVRQTPTESVPVMEEEIRLYVDERRERYLHG